MKRLLISLVAVLGLLALTTTASAGHRYYGGPQGGFGISVEKGGRCFERLIDPDHVPDDLTRLVARLFARKRADAR